MKPVRRSAAPAKRRPVPSRDTPSIYLRVVRLINPPPEVVDIIAGSPVRRRFERLKNGRGSLRGPLREMGTLGSNP